jgi:hypothetical protein
VPRAITRMFTLWVFAADEDVYEGWGRGYPHVVTAVGAAVLANVAEKRNDLEENATSAQKGFADGNKFEYN